MSRKYTLNDLERWGHIKDYEKRKLEELGFTEVNYEYRGASIRNVDKNNNYAFETSTSRRGWTTYDLHTIKPYKSLIDMPDNKRCYSLWKCIKKYLELVGDK